MYPIISGNYKINFRMHKTGCRICQTLNICYSENVLLTQIPEVDVIRKSRGSYALGHPWGPCHQKVLALRDLTKYNQLASTLLTFVNYQHPLFWLTSLWCYGEKFCLPEILIQEWNISHSQILHNTHSTNICE